MVLPIADTFNGCRTNSCELFPARKVKKEEFYFSGPPVINGISPPSSLGSSEDESPSPKNTSRDFSPSSSEDELMGRISNDIGYISITESPAASPHPSMGNMGGFIPQQPLMVSWNAHFQQLREELAKSTNRDAQTKLYRSMANLANDFSLMAETYAKIIINEFNLPPAQKSIKPLLMGGEAGGLKFLAHGIMFKFTTQAFNGALQIEQAVKIAGHDIKSLNFFIGKNDFSVGFPLMTMVDYKGYRVLACSQLPIGGNTLRYGSENAGLTIHTKEDHQIDETMTKLGKRCNLAPNVILQHDKSHTLFTPLDLEAHRGYDSRPYVVDFSRLFPPTFYNRDTSPPEKNTQFLYQLLRPELVLAFPERLYSDSISPFISRGCLDQSTNSLKKATEYLLNTVIPSFSRLLVTQEASSHSFQHLIPTIHRQGINVRYLGRIFAEVRRLSEGKSKWATFLIVEMLARCCKTLLRREFRNVGGGHEGIPGDTAFLNTAVDFLNRAFSSSDTTPKFWCSNIVLLHQKYPDSTIQPHEILEATKDELIRRLIFTRVQELVGIQFTHNALVQIEHVAFFSREVPFHAIHIKKLFAVTKNLVIMDHSKGIVLKREAKLYPDVGKDHLNAARVTFEEAFENNPSDIDCILQIADVYYKLGSNAEAREYFALASTMTNDFIVKYKCARFCHKTKAPETKIGYQCALLSNPSSFKAWYHFSLFLMEAGEDELTIRNALAAAYFLSEGKQTHMVMEIVNTHAKISGYRGREYWRSVTTASRLSVSKFWETQFATSS